MLDAPTQMLIERLSRLRTRRLADQTPTEAREAERLVESERLPGPPVGRVETLDLRIDGRTHRFTMLCPESPAAATILYFHGGGWVLGSTRQAEPVCRALATASGCNVILVDYPKAPEHPYPAAVEFGWSVLRAVARAGDESRPSGPWIVAGDSAGGNLAAVLARRAAADPAVGLALHVVVYPVLDCDFDRPSYLDAADQVLLPRESMRWFFGHYADPRQWTEPEISPLRAAPPPGLSRCVMVLAEHDVLRDEGEEYAEVLRTAGLDVDCEVMAGQMHGFFTWFGRLPASEEAVRFIAERISHVLDERG